MKQNGTTIVEYFTSLSSVCEELDSMNQLSAINTQKEEAKLF